MISHFKRILGSPTFITVFAFAVRMAFLSYASSTGPVPVRSYMPYGYELGRVAQAIAAGRGFSSPLRLVDTGPTAWFTPIYPYLAAAVFKTWGIFTEQSKLILETLNCVFAALTILPIFAIARRAFGKGVATGAAWAWVFLPTSLFYPIFWIWDSALAALFLALIFWATLAMRDAKSILPWAGYGALWVTGVLINPSLLSLFPFLVWWAIWPSFRGSTSWVKFSAAMLLVFAIGLAPWTIRNYRVFGKFIVLRSNFGLELWLGNNPNVPETWSPWLHPNENPGETAKYARMGEIAYMAEKEHEAIVFMRSHPGDSRNFMFRRFEETWLGVTDSPADVFSSPSPLLKSFLALNILLSLSSWLGVMFAYRSRHAEAAPFAMALLVFPLVFYLTHVSPRYRFPIDPIMVVLAAYGVGLLVSALRGRSADIEKSLTPAPSLPGS